MAKNDLKSAAQALYTQGHSQKTIAKMLGVAELTIGRWAKAGGWATLKKNLLTEKGNRLAELYEELQEFNRMVKEKEGYKVATSKEADARRKLITDIADLESKYNIAQITTMARDFTDFVKEINHDKAEEVMELFSAFINQQVERQKWHE